MFLSTLLRLYHGNILYISQFWIAQLFSYWSKCDRLNILQFLMYFSPCAPFLLPHYGSDVWKIRCCFGYLTHFWTWHPCLSHFTLLIWSKDMCRLYIKSAEDTQCRTQITCFLGDKHVKTQYRMTWRVQYFETCNGKKRARYSMHMHFYHKHAAWSLFIDAPYRYRKECKWSKHFQKLFLVIHSALHCSEVHVITTPHPFGHMDLDTLQYCLRPTI